MGETERDNTVTTRNPAWKWWVCGLLMLATMLNYMDRQTLSQTATAIKRELELSNEQYGRIEEAFGIAFAVGALLVGWMVDRWNVRWIYPAAVLAWSAAGFATGFARGLAGFMLCRFLLGVSEAGNWPCALRTTQHLLPPEHRTMGNGILQSGAAIGAILTPLVVLAFVDEALPGSWRLPFFVIGGLGLTWALLWLMLVRSEDLLLHQPGTGFSTSQTAGRMHRLWTHIRAQRQTLTPIFKDRRFWVLVVVVIAINTTWHYFRVWLPLFLQEDRGFTLKETSWFSAAYYLATDAGSLCAGLATLYLTRRRWQVHRSRLIVFLACALLALLSLLVEHLSGWLLLAVLLLIGFGALGLFPPYYSLTQEITVRHQGKVNGMLGCLNWIAMSQLHPLVGRLVDQQESHAMGIRLVGPIPLIGFLALLLFWKHTPKNTPDE
jgi:ACS family hexuronate transporter-like MFS transporter